MCKGGGLFWKELEFFTKTFSKFLRVICTLGGMKKFDLKILMGKQNE
jgi:hypothetical protein